MKLSLTILITFLSCFISFAQYAQIDSIEVEWENLYGPPGRVNCYAIQSDTVYAGTNYGVFRSFDGGDQWEKVTSLAQKATHGVVVKDSLILLLQFVRFNYFSAGPYGNYHIFRSTNYGNSFEMVFSKQVFSSEGIEGFYEGNIPGSYFIKNFIHGSVGDINTKLIRSTDGGATWETLGQHNFNDLFISRIGDKMLTATTFSFSSSADNFNTITEYPMPGAAETPYHQKNMVGIGSLADTVYVCFNNGAIHKTTDLGATWHSDTLDLSSFDAPQFSSYDLISSFWLVDTTFYFKVKNHYNGMENFFRATDRSLKSFVQILPGEPIKNYFVVSFFPFSDKILASDTRGATMVSTDFGDTWQGKSLGLYNGTSELLSIDDEIRSGYFKHTDNDVWELLPNTAYAGPEWQFLQHNGYYFNVENGKVLRMPIGGGDWEQVFVWPGSASSFWLDDLAIHNNRVFILGNSWKWYYSEDAGTSWQTLELDIPLGLLHAEGNRLSAVGAEGLWFSSDLGATWTLAAALSQKFKNLFINDHKLVAVFEKGEIWTSYYDGETWQQTGLPFDQYAIGGYQFDHYISSFYTGKFLVLNLLGGMFISKDDGKHWTAIKDLPGRLWFLQQQINFSYPKWVQAGTSYLENDGMFYMTTTGNSSWRTPSDNMSCLLEPLYTTVTDSLIFAGDWVLGNQIFADTSFLLQNDDIMGCDSFELVNIHVLPLPVETIEEKPVHNLSIFPNPGSEGFVVSLPGSILKLDELVIFDNFGRRVKNQRFNQKEFMEGSHIIVTTSDLSAGIYFVFLINEFGHFSSKWIKE